MDQGLIQARIAQNWVFFDFFIRSGYWSNECDGVWRSVMVWSQVPHVSSEPAALVHALAPDLFAALYHRV